MDGFIPNVDRDRLPWWLKVYKATRLDGVEEELNIQPHPRIVSMVLSITKQGSPLGSCMSSTMGKGTESCSGPGLGNGRAGPHVTLATTHLTCDVGAPLQCFCGTRSANGLHKCQKGNFNMCDSVRIPINGPHSLN